MKDCEYTLKQLDAWLDEAIDSDARHAIETHLANCEKCRAAFDAQAALADDLMSLATLSGRIAAGSQVQPVEKAFRWGRIAAMFLVAVGLGTAVMMTQQESDPETRVVDQQPQQVDVISDALRPEIRQPRIALADGDPRLPVRLETKNPRVHIVWLYDTVGVSAQVDPPQQDETEPSTAVPPSGKIVSTSSGPRPAPSTNLS